MGGMGPGTAVSDGMHGLVDFDIIFLSSNSLSWELIKNLGVYKDVDVWVCFLICTQSVSRLVYHQSLVIFSTHLSEKIPHKFLAQPQPGSTANLSSSLSSISTVNRPTL